LWLILRIFILDRKPTGCWSRMTCARRIFCPPYLRDERRAPGRVISDQAVTMPHRATSADRTVLKFVEMTQARAS